MRKLVLDTGPFLLLFTKENGSEKIKRIIIKHEIREMDVYIHPNNLAEAYMVFNKVIREKTGIPGKKIKPEDIIRSAYATLNVVQDEATTIKLGELKTKYRRVPWGDLSAAALALRLGGVPVIILDNEKHFNTITEVETIKISELKV